MHQISEFISSGPVQVTMTSRRYLWEQMPSISRIRGNYHIFNTYFFNKLEDFASKGSEVDSADCFLKLRRWWKGVDIFRKDYILFPVHAEFHNRKMDMTMVCLLYSIWSVLSKRHLTGFAGKTFLCLAKDGFDQKRLQS